MPGPTPGLQAAGSEAALIHDAAPGYLESEACGRATVTGMGKNEIVQVSEGESPKSPSDSTEDWDNAPTILPGTYEGGTPPH